MNEEFDFDLEPKMDSSFLPYFFQITVSRFYQWYHISGHVVPIVLAFFLGSWSDRRGRKLPLLLGLFGKLIYSSMILVNVYHSKCQLTYL